MPNWLTPMVYTVVSAGASFVLPRLEERYLADFVHPISAQAAIAFYSAVSSGMMALTGIVFAIAFVVVQFSAAAYSPRVVLVFANTPTTFHALGVFFATFTYSLAALAWTDRSGSGRVPLFSSAVVLALLFTSLVLFTRLIQSINRLQIDAVLRSIGAFGRRVIGEMYGATPRYGARVTMGMAEREPTRGVACQTVLFRGEPLIIQKFEIDKLLRIATRANGLLVLEYGVGDTVIDGTVLVTVHDARHRLPEEALLRCIHLGTARTHEQDPKYALRLLVDIALRALSPGINDPTTAVQALDQIEDLLRRLGRVHFDVGRLTDADGVLRLIIPVPTWDDYLALSFDEIRQFGTSSVQVVRRLRSVLAGLADVVSGTRRAAVLRYLNHLDQGLARADLDEIDKGTAMAEDRQGLGLSRKPAHPSQASASHEFASPPGT